MSHIKDIHKRCSKPSFLLQRQLKSPQLYFSSLPQFKVSLEPPRQRPKPTCSLNALDHILLGTLLCATQATQTKIS